MKINLRIFFSTNALIRRLRTTSWWWWWSMASLKRCLLPVIRPRARTRRSRRPTRWRPASLNSAISTPSAGRHLLRQRRRMMAKIWQRANWLLRTLFSWMRWLCCWLIHYCRWCFEKWTENCNEPSRCNEELNNSCAWILCCRNNILSAFFSSIEQ